MSRVWRALSAFLVAAALLPAAPARAATLVVGVVDSESTYVNLAQLGWWPNRPTQTATALAAQGFTVVTLHDADLENPAKLASVDVVFLPYTRVMNESASLTLRDWVAAGGGLVASLASPRMFPRPGCRWTGSQHPRQTASWSRYWTCTGSSDGGFDFWKDAFNSNLWEFGPLSEAYQTRFVNDPSSQLRVVADPGGKSHPIVSGTLSALGITGIRLDRTAAGAEFTRLFAGNGNVTSLLQYSIPTTYAGYTAAQAIGYGKGRVVYFDFSIVDFLPGVCLYPDQPCNLAYQGTTEGDIAAQLVRRSIDWAAAGGSAPISRKARTWGSVDVSTGGIHIRQSLADQGNVVILADLSARIYDPAGRLVYSYAKRHIAVYPGGSALTYSLPGYSTSRLADGTYRVEVQAVYSYPGFDRTHIEAVNVTRGQGTGIATAAVYDGPVPARWSGADRYATAAAISAAAFAPGVPVAYVATGTAFPDALAGTAAARGKGPILLVSPTSIPGVTARELGRLKPQKIVVLGGTGAVSSGVASALAAYTTGSVSRFAGADRFATAAAISRNTFAPGVPVAFVATGADFPDALAGGPWAARAGGPILLTTAGSLPGATRTELARLRPEKIVVLGGTAVVSPVVVSQLAAYTTGSVQRVSGADRYATAEQISRAAFPSAGVPVAFVATAADFPDALAGGSAAAAGAGPVLLVTPTAVPPATVRELTRLKPQKIVVLGGPAAVSDGVRARLALYLP